MGIIAVLVAAAVAWGFGAFWYGITARPWMAASGMTQEKAKAMGPMPYAISVVCMIVVAGFMQYIFFIGDVTGSFEGMTIGAGIGLFFIIPWMLLNNSYSGRPLMLSLIDGAYAFFGTLLMGAILTILA